MHPSGFLVLLFLVLFSGTSAQSNGSFSANGASVTWTVNGDTVTFQMTGDSSGYLALGLSADTRMGTDGIDDVMACHRDGSGSVTIKDTHNPQSQSPRANNLDSTSDLVAISASVTGNTITCSFSRLITTGDPQDRSLNESVYLFLAMSGNPGAANVGLNRHGSSGSNVGISSSPVVIAPEENATVVEPTTPPTDPPVQDPSGSFSGNGVSVTWTVNDDTVTYQMTGDSSGFLALGLSADRVMGTDGIDDVMACHRDGSGSVNIKDTYNPVSPRGNNLDSTSDLVAISASLSGSTITCSFSRLITTGDSQDRSLNESVYLLLVKGGNVGNAGVGLNFHGAVGTNVAVSSSRVVIAEGGAVASGGCSTPVLIRVHGILMFIAWGCLVLMAYHFAAHMKPAMVSGIWFKFHLALMLTAVIFTLAGFILIFVEFRDNAGLIRGFGMNNRTGTVHMIFGIFVVFLMILNPVIAIFRCKPDHKRRWIFDMLHGRFVGWFAICLAWTTMALGVSRFGDYSGNRVAFIFFICFLVVHVLGDLALVLYNWFIYPRLKKKWEENEVQSPDVGQSVQISPSGDDDKVNLGDDGSEKPKKKKSKDWKFRYAMMIVKLSFIAASTIVMIVLLGIACI